jgi:hypothetical protein
MIVVYIVNLSNDCSRSVRRHRPDQQEAHEQTLVFSIHQSPWLPTIYNLPV